MVGIIGLVMLGSRQRRVTEVDVTGSNGLKWTLTEKISTLSATPNVPLSHNLNAPSSSPQLYPHVKLSSTP